MVRWCGRSFRFYVFVLHVLSKFVCVKGGPENWTVLISL